MYSKDWIQHHDKFKLDKPLKYLYPDQKEVMKQFVSFILPYLRKHPFFNKAWIWGSLPRGLFGVYESAYRNQEGSDCDLLTEVDERFEIPSELKELRDWVKTRTYSRAFSSTLRFVYKTEQGAVAHHVDFICHFPSTNTKEGFFKKVDESVILYEK